MNTATQLSKRTNNSEVNQLDTVAPRVDIFENGEELLLFADVPGASADGIDVRLDDGRLTIQAKRVAEPTPLHSGLAEQRAPDFFRVFSVPAGIDGANVEAHLRDGVLQVRLPKPASIKPRRIEVKLG